MRSIKQTDATVDKEFDEVDRRLSALERATGITETNYVESVDYQYDLDTSATSNVIIVDVSNWTHASVQSAVGNGSPPNLNIKVSNTRTVFHTFPSGAKTITAGAGIQADLEVSSFKYLIIEPASGVSSTDVVLNIHLRKVTP